MATILAAATGNWSATGTWTGGVVPVAGDIVVANNKTVTMDTLTVTVAELRNDTTGGAVAGGTFNLVSGSNVTANVFAGTTGSCVTWVGTTGQTATLTGNVAAGAGGVGINCTGGNLTIGGGAQITGATGSSTNSGIVFASSGTFTFATAGNPGNITGGTSSSGTAYGINCTGASANITIYANTIAGPTSGAGPGLNFNNASQTVNIVAANIGTTTSTAATLNAAGASANHTYTVSGNIVGPAAATSGVAISSTGTYNITVGGSINGGTGSGATALVNSNLATVNITGNITNGANAQAGANYSITNSSTGTVSVTGTLTAGAIQHTAQNSATGIFRCTRAKGNGYGAGSAGVNNVQAILSNAQGALTYIEELEFGSLGNTPVTGPIRLTAATTNRAIFTTTTGTTKTLVDTAATSGVLPAATDVRTGVVYSSGNRTGTCAVPAAGSVALGVPVDNTTGTAVLTAANARTALGLASANLDTQLSGISASVSALPSAATIASTVWDALTSGLSTASSIGKLLVDNVNATISSRLASSSYTVPLDAVGTRSAVGLSSANLDTQLAAIPTAAAPSSVDIRTELDANSTKLANLDATVSSRLATSGYTAPPSSATIATAVWAAATRTLTTAIDNSSTIAAAVWSYATGRTITGGTVDTLTNAPTVPSAAAIATQVRTELSTELGRIDVATSTRLAPSGTLARVTLVDTTTTLTNAPSVPSAAAIATQVRTELTPELARMANAATVDTTGQQIQDAVTN